MRSIFGLLTVGIIFFTACAAQKKTSGSSPEVSYVQMWRTSCFGRCPNYKIELYSDGLVRYTGKQFADTGIYEKNIGVAAAKKYLNNFAEKRIDTLRDTYEMQVADLPGINYIFKTANGTKKVQHAEFGPMFLRELAKELDELVRENQFTEPKMDATWKKISNSPLGD